MAGQDVAELAFEQAWRVYRLINPSVDADDEKRALLHRFIRNRCAAGASDLELMVMEGLKYLKLLDEAREPD
jgi:hypothetical protein